MTRSVAAVLAALPCVRVARGGPFGRARGRAGCCLARVAEARAAVPEAERPAGAWLAAARARHYGWRR